MDANRLHAVYTAIRHYQNQGLCEGNEYEELEAAYDEICQQQAEIERLREDKRRLFEVYDAQYARSCEYAGQIERLNRAYEYLCNELSWLGKDSVIVAAQRIKEGKGGEQG